jgi:uncharacterized membrane protein YphA (DoxX/SURF4 family)
LFSTFPDGRPGAGLFILRTLLGTSALVQSQIYLYGQSDLKIVTVAIGTLGLVVGLLLIIGFLTPILSFFLFLTQALLLLLSVDLGLGNVTVLNFIEIYILLLAISLVLLGPGAFSLDARLFGRREIIIPTNRTD